jgi:hypothetical protein
MGTCRSLQITGRRVQHMREIFGPMVVMLATIAGIVLIVRIASSSARARRESEALFALHGRLIEKFGTSKELLEYLSSDAGKRFLTPPPALKGVPYRRILAALQAGTVLTFVGVAFLLTCGAFEQDAMRAMSFTGAFLLAFGLGFIASGIVAYRLSSRWGLLNGEQKDASETR